MATCSDCTEPAQHLCSVCGQNKCSTHLQMVYFKVDTGYQAGFDRLTRDGYRPDWACLACQAGPTVADAQKLRNSDEPLEIARLLRAKPYRTSGTGRPILDAANKAWAAAVEDTWTRLMLAGAFGPPNRDIFTTVGRRVNEWTFTFDSGTSQPGWFVPSAIPWTVIHGVESVCTERGLIDVWITEDGRALGREDPYLPLEKSTLSGGGVFNRPKEREPVSVRDSKCRAGNVIVAVPRGKVPRASTGTKPGFFRELVTPNLIETINLSDDPPDKRTMNINGRVREVGLSLGMAALLERSAGLRPAASEPTSVDPPVEDPLAAIARAAELAAKRSNGIEG